MLNDYMEEKKKKQYTIFNLVRTEKHWGISKIYSKNISIGTINLLLEKTKISLREALKAKERSKMCKKTPFHCLEKICIGVILM